MIVVLSTYPDKEKAEEAAKLAVMKDLAACVNIVKIENSIYKWKDKIENHPEFLLIMKTTDGNYEKLEKFIKENHPYDVCELVKLDVKGGNKDYVQWVDSTVSKD